MECGDLAPLSWHETMTREVAAVFNRHAYPSALGMADRIRRHGKSDGRKIMGRKIRDETHAPFLPLQSVQSV